MKIGLYRGEHILPGIPDPGAERTKEMVSMDVEEKVRLDENKKTVEIVNLIIDDINVYSYLSNVKPEFREEVIKKCIIAGCVGLRNITLIENVDYIQKEFNQLMNNFKDQNNELMKELTQILDVENTQSPFGKFKLLFEEYFDLKKGKIGDLLDPFAEGTPIRKLRDEILKKITELREELIKEKEMEKIVSKTTLKGKEFEDLVYQDIQLICVPYQDTVEYVADKIGNIGKQGDIIIDVNGDASRRIVIECKDSTNYSSKKVNDEIESAIKNRDAKFGIFLFNRTDQVPTELQPLKITNKYIVTSFENNGLYIAFRVARLFVEKEKEIREIKIPIDKIQKELEELKEKMELVNDINKKLTQIDNASSYIRENINRLKKDVEDTIEKIKKYIA